MKIAKIRAVLWDLDGTLLDSADNHWLAWRAALAEMGFDLSRERFLETFGQRGSSILDRFFPDLPEVEKKRLLETKRRRYREIGEVEGLRLFPGAREWLERLKQQGWHQAIASSSPRRIIDLSLGKLKIASFFEAIAAGDEVASGKPDPEVFLLAAKKIEVAPHRCIVVEDAPAGIEGAKRAGMKTIGIRSSHPALEAEIYSDSLASLPLDAFDRLLNSP